MTFEKEFAKKISGEPRKILRSVIMFGIANQHDLNIFNITSKFLKILKKMKIVAILNLSD